MVELVKLQSWERSPEQISAIAKFIELPVSHEWIYRYIAQGGQLYTCLRQGHRQGHKRYRKGRNSKHSPILEARSIDERLAIVATRKRLADRDADTVRGSRESVRW